jgi:hypothetical protein
VAGQPSTVVKARYSRGLKAALQLAKGHVRYAVHRCNEQGERQYREVWDRDGRIGKLAAYERIDRVHEDDFVYRLTLSPHPEYQHASRQLELRAWTQHIMQRLERDLSQRVDWFAVSHEHPDHRHVHVVAISPRRLEVGHFRAMRDAGDNHALAQQRQYPREVDRRAASTPESQRMGDRRRDRDVSAVRGRRSPDPHVAPHQGSMRPIRHRT